MLMLTRAISSGSNLFRNAPEATTQTRPHGDYILLANGLDFLHSPQGISFLHTCSGGSIKIHGIALIEAINLPFLLNLDIFFHQDKFTKSLER